MIRYLSGSRSWWNHVKTASEATHFTHDLFTSGDYSGCAVEVANRRAILENTELCERLGIEELNEAYSTDSVLFPIAALKDPEIVKMFESLDRYPALDDSLISEIESELEKECFDSFGARDFKELLRVNDLITDDQADEITEDQLGEIYFSASRETNYNVFEVESGTSGYFNFESFGGLYSKKIEVLKPIIKEVLK